MNISRGYNVSFIYYFQEQVLVNIMEIFTFIGSTILRQDDAYSIQLISKIVETVIPILVKVRTFCKKMYFSQLKYMITVILYFAFSFFQSQKNTELEEGVTNVLRVFVAAIMHVPEHRRVPLFKKLLVSLNDGEYMWIFLCLVFEKHVLDFNTQRMSDGSKWKYVSIRFLQFKQPLSGILVINFICFQMASAIL